MIIAVNPSRILLLCLWLWWPGQALFAGVGEPVVRDLSVLVDPDGTETIASIAGGDPARFLPLRGGSLAAGYSRKVHWLRFALADSAGEWYLDILPPYLDDLRLYVPDLDQPGVFSERRAGDLLPFAAREVPYRGFVFPLRLPDGRARHFYLRLATTSSSVLVPRLWSPAAFHAAASLEAGLLFASLAILLTVMLLALNNWFWLRDPLSPWFLGYVGCLFLNMAATAGFVGQYLLPEAPDLANHWVRLTALGAIACGNGFYRLLFGVDPGQRVLYGLYQAGIWVPLAFIPLTFVGYQTEVMSPVLQFVLVMNGVGLYLATRLWRRREAGGGFMLIANLISMLGLLVLMLLILGYISGGLPSLYSLHIASLGTVLALYLAVGARYRGLLDERQHAQEGARQAHAEARRERAAREEQSGLFAMISHEIKTPLTMIDGAVQSLQALVTGEPEVDRRHQRIRRAVERINALVEKTLEYDRIGLETLSLERHSSVDLTRLTSDLLAGYALPASRLSLVEAEPCLVLGNPGLLEVMLANLVDNALKYSPAETQVAVRVRPGAPTAVLEVCDQGPGIPPTLRPILFGRYVRGADVGDIPGTGLGLYLVRRIARWHGGEVECRDLDAGRHCLLVTLPLYEPLQAG